MPEQQLGVGEVVEDAAEDQPEGVGRRIQAPAPHRTGEFRVPGQHVGGVNAVGRVKVKRDVQALGHRPDLPQRLVVQVRALRVRVDERAAQAQLRDRALELAGGGGRILQGERGESAEARRVARDDLGQEVVDRGRLPGGHRGVGFGLDTRRVQRQHGDVDAARVHRREPLLGQILQPPQRLRPRARLRDRRRRRAVAGELRRDEVFFKRNGPHVLSR